MPDVCPECGFRPAPGEPPCEKQRDLLLARDYEQSVLYWQYHRLAIDAYCVQHSSYVASAKSLAAHLCGLLIAFEYANDAQKLRKLQKWLSTNPKIERPQLPSRRGDLTIGHLQGITDPDAYGVAVKEWAQSAWQAYSSLHPFARHWLSLPR